MCDAIASHHERVQVQVSNIEARVSSCNDIIADYYRGGYIGTDIIILNYFKFPASDKSSSLEIRAAIARATVTQREQFNIFITATIVTVTTFMNPASINQLTT